MKLDIPGSLRRFALPAALAALAVVVHSQPAQAYLFGRSASASEGLDQAPALYNSQTMPLMKAGSQVTAEPLALEDGSFAASAGPLGVVYDTTVGGTISRYTVRSGDTIETIAETFGVSKNTIVWANDLKRPPAPGGRAGGATISVGQELVILPVSGVRYVVQKSGERIADIAKKFGGDAAEIEQYNDVDSTVLAKGTELIIPDGEIAAPEPKKSAPKKVVQKETSTLFEEDHDDHEDETVSAKPKKLPTRVSVTVLKDPTGYFMVPLKTGTRTQKLHGLNGVDLAAPTGTPIYAAAAGTVILVKGGNAWNGGYGNYVVIEHGNGTQTLYAHNSKNLVSTGQTVAKGEQIALLGSTGKSTGPHVHFEVRGKGAKNPLAN
ncbi:MAG TPA: peptidoglycan DD-metalloendopeptidase family protein [Candidatus Paceibacterota bacterium]|nr:peptidoglycan DD-metalloendopeptidase family protein [Candidatus Paceibacterota bacterium]